MVIGILTEKPSAARHFAAALGGASGTYDGERFVIAHARGHLYEFVEPHKMVDASLEARYEKWDLANLPWDAAAMDWSLEPIKDTVQVRNDLRSTLSRCDEIVCATDVDPTGEGGLIAVNAFLELGLRPKRWSRMYFTDEAPTSLRRAFSDRKPITSLADFDEYRKARYRAQFDLLSMQFTRIATNVARQCGQDAVLRQGRLKSAMVTLVGDQLRAYNDYVKRPFFQNRFRDENGVVYTSPEEPRHEREEQVPAQYELSTVVVDGTARKQLAPPRLLDLAALSSILVGKGVKAGLVLSTYQKMYEAQVVSYPRTEDKTITPEQFAELSPLIDKVAGVAGVDRELLTRREPRGTHVKRQGTHGANRPGPSVPSSLEAVEQRFGKAGRLIYETLAKNYLAMFAGDYVYEQHRGHVEKYPEFVGIANVPLSMGWKQVFDPDAGEDTSDEETESTKGLGRRAAPFVFEGANKHPEHPSMRWLMKQLETRDVGTGATRTSTYAEVTSTTTKHPLLVEKGRRLLLAHAGELSWRLLPGTRIGDLSLTERVYTDMREIATGTGATAEERLAAVADWVREDIETMRKNGAVMRAALGLDERVVSARVEGVWQTAPGGARKVAFKKFWSRHEFTHTEVAQLLAGEKISFEATNKAGKPFAATGALGVGEHNGRRFVGFQPEVPDGPTSWCGRRFTAAEKDALLAGRSIARSDWRSEKTGNTFACTVSWDAGARKIVPDFGSDDDPPRSWCQVTFTEQQRQDLAAGKTIQGTGFVSGKSGRTFDAKLTWKRQGGKRKLVPSFD